MNDYHTRNEIHKDEVLEKYKNCSYRDLVNGLDKTKVKGYCPNVENLCEALGVPWDMSFYDVPFLKEYESGLNWVCTDTTVGVFLLFMVYPNGLETFVGTRERPYRKWNDTYRFVSTRMMERVTEKLLELIQAEPNDNVGFLSFNDNALLSVSKKFVDLSKL